eukprot:SAG11_NODE_2583_length_3195_cov_188.324935_3_plen_39_part_00
MVGELEPPKLLLLKIVHAGDVGPPLMGRADGALDIEAL